MGMPSPGEAGCDVGCVRQLTSYLAVIHRWVRAFAAPVSTGQPSGSRPDPYVGGATYCAIPDPTDTGGCITAATAWLLRQLHDRPARRLPPPSRRRPRLGPGRMAADVRQLPPRLLRDLPGPDLVGGPRRPRVAALQRGRRLRPHRPDRRPLRPRPRLTV